MTLGLTYLGHGAGVHANSKVNRARRKVKLTNVYMGIHVDVTCDKCRIKGFSKCYCAHIDTIPSNHTHSYDPIDKVYTRRVALAEPDEI